MRCVAHVAALFAGVMATVSAEAASLRVAPVILDLSAPTAASSIRIWNDAKKPINVQVRVFRWSQKDGKDVYTIAEDVVVSPPLTTLKGNGENMVRVVRVSKRPVAREESYRLVVDELPSAGRRPAGTVVLVVRHSIPVFFSQPEAEGASARWSVRRAPDGYEVTVRNSGDKRLKISNLDLIGQGKTIARSPGLVGYVLGNSTASWTVPATARSALTKSVKIRAQSEAGNVDAVATLSKSD